MDDDKAQLLHSLEIDRSEPANSGNGRPTLWIIVAFVLGIATTIGVTRPWDKVAADATPPSVVNETTGAAATTAPSPATSAAPTPTAASPVRPSAGLIASGYVVARRTATVSAELTGKVKEVLVEEGMVVTEGQVLARLDSIVAEISLADAQSGVVAASASIAVIQAELSDADRTLARITQLAKSDYASNADLIRAQSRAQSARAQLAQARAQLEGAKIGVRRAEDQVARHTVRAPFAGVVTVKNAQPGEIISPLSSGGFTRTGVCTLVDMDSLEIEVDVNEANIGRVHPGQRVEAVLDAYQDWKIPAQVIAIIPTADRSKATIKVRVGLQQKDARVLPDMAAKVTLFDSAASNAN